MRVRLAGLAVAAGLTAGAVLTGCSGGGGPASPSEGGGGERVQQQVMETDHGTYLCFIYTTTGRGGIWCEGVEG